MSITLNFTLAWNHISGVCSQTWKWVLAVHVFVSLHSDDFQTWVKHQGQVQSCWSSPGRSWFHPCQSLWPTHKVRWSTFWQGERTWLIYLHLNLTSVRIVAITLVYSTSGTLDRAYVSKSRGLGFEFFQILGFFVPASCFFVFITIKNSALPNARRNLKMASAQM